MGRKEGETHYRLKIGLERVDGGGHALILEDNEDRRCTVYSKLVRNKTGRRRPAKEREYKPRLAQELRYLFLSQGFAHRSTYGMHKEERDTLRIGKGAFIDILYTEVGRIGNVDLRPGVYLVTHSMVRSEQPRLLLVPNREYDVESYEDRGRALIEMLFGRTPEEYVERKLAEQRPPTRPKLRSVK